jgi:lipopolysaccharide transport system permease protein/teichoic acid transport system permease protein
LRQIADRYAGTWMGFAWAVVHPVMLLAVFWFVFEKGLRIGGTNGQPYVLQLFSGLVPWMLVQEAVSGAAGAVTGRSYLVKKISFPSEILPYTHVFAALVTHVLLVGILLLMMLWYGTPLKISAMTAFYYLFCLIALVSGMSVLLAALNVFYRDVGQVLGVALNLWFWFTPIVWAPSLLPSNLTWLLAINPLHYVVQGYRDSLLGAELNLPSGLETLWFWAFSGGLYLVAQFVFKRLKPSFADML